MDATSPGVGPSGHAVHAVARRESKYIVDPVLIAPMRQFVRSLARLDPQAETSGTHTYPVCSLYLDTDDLRFFWQYRNGARSRFKLRVRTYSDDPSAPVFLEVKWRVDRLVTKQRAVLDRQQALSVLESRTDGATWRRLPTQRALEAFTTDLALTSARPVVRVKYLREAYVATGPAPARVTFDTALEYQPTLEPTLTHQGGRWMSIPLGGVVVEIKSSDQYPLWIDDMIGTFGLVQQPCCKYALSVERMIATGGTRWMSLAGFTMPRAQRWGPS
jgi:hypothetical protein